MSAVEKLIDEILEENNEANTPSHSLSVTVTAAQHTKLVNLSMHLGVAKTNLASRLLSAAIDEAATKILTKPTPNPVTALMGKTKQ